MNFNRSLCHEAVRITLPELELYGAHTPCAASQLHGAYMFVYEHVCVTCSYIYTCTGDTLSI